MKKKQRILDSVSRLFMLFATVCAGTALIRFASPFAAETSRLRQLDGILLPVLTAVCAAGILVMLLVAFLKKTAGRYAPFGMVLWGLTILLYSLITPYRVMKILYAPALQKMMLKVDIHIDVTTIQSVKTFAEALNLLAGAACVLLGAAVVISLIRRLPLSGHKAAGGGLAACLAIWAGLVFGYAVCGPIAQRWGYSVLFGAAAAVVVLAGLAALVIRPDRREAVPEAVA